MTTWIEDENGNKCSVEYFGIEEAARKALESLENCKNCINCSRCSDCSGCSRCSDCSGCSRCSDCSGCSRCSYCSRCSDCSGCSRCSDCSGCSGCSGCSDCSRCSDCSGCSRCSDCSGCSHIANLYDKNKLAAEPGAVSGNLGVPIVPVIENIHQAVFAAVSKPDALNMDTWHTCETTHCRAGWVVHLAGEEGKALERFHDTPLAALLIYYASSPDLLVSPTRFFESNEIAMEDMRRLAEEEAAKPV